jgi:hypothetical protein
MFYYFAEYRIKSYNDEYFYVIVLIDIKMC